MIVIDGVTIEGTDKALTWADEFIKDLLTEEEKYHDVLLDISSDAISDTMSKLKVYSDEFKAGADILAEQAYGRLGRAQGEALEETYEELFPVITTLAPPPPGVDDEIDTLIFDTERKAALVIEETNARINELMAGIEAKEAGFWRTLEQNLNIIFDSLWEPIWEWYPELEADVTYQLAALPAVLLFEAFKNFFFEED